jgi:hypothetical protein
MAYTIEQIQTFINEKGNDARQLINMVADYLQANPPGESSPGGSSYLVYTALLSQTGTNAPVATVLENTLGTTIVWTRDDVGEYIGTFTISPTAKLYVGGQSNIALSQVVIPLSDFGSITGYLYITVQNSAGNCTIFLATTNAAFSEVEWSSIIGTIDFSLPKIEVYP